MCSDSKNAKPYQLKYHECVFLCQKKLVTVLGGLCTGYIIMLTQYFRAPEIFVTDAGEFSFIGVVRFILAPVLLFCYMLFILLQQRIHYHKKDYRLIVTENEICFRNDTEELRYTYTDVSNIENRKIYFNFHAPNKNHFIIPKRLLNENELNIIEQEI